MLVDPSEVDWAMAMGVFAVVVVVAAARIIVSKHSVHNSLLRYLPQLHWSNTPLWRPMIGVDLRRKFVEPSRRLDWDRCADLGRHGTTYAVLRNAETTTRDHRPTKRTNDRAHSRTPWVRSSRPVTVR